MPVCLGRNVIIEFRRSGPNTQLCGFGSRTGQSSCSLESEGKAMNKKSIVEWCRRMKQFHCETQEGLGGFAAAIVQSQDVPAIAQSDERDALAFTNAAIRWGAMIESGTWQLCLACEYKFRSAKFARAFVSPICEEPTMAILVGVCEECSQKDDGELLEIAYQDCRKMGLAKNKMNIGRA